MSRMEKTSPWCGLPEGLFKEDLRMKHPIDEYRDAQKMKKLWDSKHANAKRNGFYEGTSGASSGFYKLIRWFLLLLLLLSVFAIAALIATGNEAVIKGLIG